ncbi:MAG: hypothetical protein Q9172_006818 [Xanthocarpia lactea]
MLPDFLQSTFKTYKEDTNTVASWLAVKARQCGYPADLLTNSYQLKRTARKEAKEGKNSLTGLTYVIQVKDFISLAEFIAGFTKPVVQVPHALVKALNRAIELRSLHNDWSRTQQSSFESDDAHSYFLGILERTREVLRPRMPVVDDSISGTFASLSLAAGRPNTQSAEPAGNIFDHLKLEEPTQAFLDAPEVVQANHARPSNEPRYEAEVVQSPEEKYLAAHCLFQDIRNIRSFLRALWANYRDHQVDLVAASITTNTAVDLVRGLESDFTQQYPDMAGYEEISRLFYAVQCVHRGHHPNYKERADDHFNFKMYDIAEESMLPTYIILSSLQDVISPVHALVYKPGHFGNRDKRTTWAQKPAREKFQDDKLVLLEGFPDLHLLATTSKQKPLAEDDFLRGIRDMEPDRDIPLWLVFAAQCFLDTQHVLEHELDRGYADLKRTATTIKTTIEENLDFHTSLRVTNWPKENDLVMKEMISVIDQWVLKDLLAERARKLRKNLGVEQQERFRLLRQYPLLCGLFIFALKSRFQEMGITFVNAWGSVMYTAHLYNAVRQEKLLKTAWKDMEFVIMMQSPEILFIGNVPSNLEEYFKRFLLSMGYSATAFASNRRTNIGAMASARGPRSLKELGHVDKIFGDRYCNNAAAVAFTWKSIQALVDAKIEIDSEDEDEAQEGASSEAKQTASGTLVRRSSHRGTSIPTLGFLEDLANALHAEQVEMSIDYLLLHRTCWQLLRQVNIACKSKLLEMYGGGYLEKENQLPFVVGYIFMAATQTKKVANLLLPKLTEEVTSKLLATAGGVVEKYVKTKSTGDTLVRMLRREYGYNLDFGELDDLVSR